jgi:hypothetical protein
LASIFVGTNIHVTKLCGSTKIYINFTIPIYLLLWMTYMHILWGLKVGGVETQFLNKVWFVGQIL